MSLEHPLGRLIAAVAAIVVVGVGMRALLSVAICLRGDAILASLGPRYARPYYDRARWFDSRNTVAVDRIAFMTLLRPFREDVAKVLGDPEIEKTADSGLLLDRALLEERSRRFLRAADDFKVLARRFGNSRYMFFAALLERGHRPNAIVRADMEAALHLDPKNTLARRALERLQ